MDEFQQDCIVVWDKGRLNKVALGWPFEGALSKLHAYNANQRVIFSKEGAQRQLIEWRMGYPTSMESYIYSTPPGRYEFLSIKIPVFPYKMGFHISVGRRDSEGLSFALLPGADLLFKWIFSDFSDRPVWPWSSGARTFDWAKIEVAGFGTVPFFGMLESPGSVFCIW
jgi:hypothetical protein